MKAGNGQPFDDLDLHPDEIWIWQGRPGAGYIYERWHLLQFPFCFAVACAALTMVLGNLSRGQTDSLLLFPLAVLALGILGIAGPLLIEPRRRARTAYALTNQRVIIRTWFREQSTASIALQALTDVSIAAKRCGRGTITFDKVISGLCQLEELPDAQPLFEKTKARIETSPT